MELRKSYPSVVKVAELALLDWHKRKCLFSQMLNSPASSAPSEDGHIMLCIKRVSQFDVLRRRTRIQLRPNKRPETKGKLRADRIVFSVQTYRQRTKLTAMMMMMATVTIKITKKTT
jgi:hypothetical protein